MHGIDIKNALLLLNIFKSQVSHILTKLVQLALLNFISLYLKLPNYWNLSSTKALKFEILYPPT